VYVCAEKPFVKAHSHHLIILLTRFHPQGASFSFFFASDEWKGREAENGMEKQRKVFPFPCFLVHTWSKIAFNTFKELVIAHHILTAVNNSDTCCYIVAPFNSLILQSNNAFLTVSDAVIIHVFSVAIFSAIWQEHAFLFASSVWFAFVRELSLPRILLVLSVVKGKIYDDRLRSEVNLGEFWLKLSYFGSRLY
jgi:hypothetical protein